MKDSRTIKLLETLSEKERESFISYLGQPYINQTERLILLAALFHDRMLEDVEIEKSKILQTIQRTEKNYTYLHLRQDMNRLLRYLEQFITNQALSNDNGLHTILLLHHLERHSLDSHFQTTARKGIIDLENATKQNGDHFLSLYRIEEERFRNTVRRAQLTDRLVKSDMAAMHRHLDDYYHFSKLKLYCAGINLKNIGQENAVVEPEEEYLKYIQNSLTQRSEGVVIYFHILMSLLQPEKEEHYQQLHDHIDQYSGHFTDEEAREMYIYAQNYCIKKANAGESKYLRELLELYKMALDKKVIFQEGYLSPWDYKNIVSVGLLLKEHQWTKTFIEDHKEFIKPAYRENAYRYNLANLYFALQQYNKVMEHLHLVEYNDVFYGLSSRSLLLRTYFEMDETEALFSLGDSFALYLRRNKSVAKTHRESYLNFTAFTKKLARANYRNKERLKKLQSQLNIKPNTADRKWLYNKMEEMSSL